MASKSGLKRIVSLVAALLVGTTLANTASRGEPVGGDTASRGRKTRINFRQLYSGKNTKSVSRRFKDTLRPGGWKDVEDKEKEQNRAMASGKVAVKKAAEQQEYDRIQEDASLVARKLRRLETQKQAEEILFPHNKLMGIPSTADFSIRLTEQRLAEFNKMLDKKASEIWTLDRQESDMDKERNVLAAAQLLNEAGFLDKNGYYTNNFDTLMKNPESRAKIQKNIDKMYHNYLSKVPPCNLENEADRAFVKLFLDKLAGIRKGVRAHDPNLGKDIPDYLRRKNGGR